MFHQPMAFQRRIIVTVVLCLALTPLLWDHAHTAPTATAAQLCGWPRGAIGSKGFGNTGVVDNNALYLVMTYARQSGTALRIHGQFPHSRYMSFTAYSSGTAQTLDHILDAQIVPDRGSSNPFLPDANRNSSQRWYTVYIRQGLPPVGVRPVNTLYTGPYHPVLVMYRVYAPDKGADDYGDVGAPSVSLIIDRAHKLPVALPLATCSPLQPLKGAAAVFGSLPASFVWKRVGASSIGVNVDDAYLDLKYQRTDAEVFMFRFKPPSFAQTYTGKPITGRENVRFWSLCQYDQKTGAVTTCLHDDQALYDASGKVTVVVSTEAFRPAGATAVHHINWLPFGDGDTAVLVYRQLLARPDFPGNLQNIAPTFTIQQIRQTMGSYYPQVQACSEQDWTPTSCTDLINYKQCSDLLEPMPCKPLVPQRRRATLPLAARPAAAQSTQTVQ